MSRRRACCCEPDDPMEDRRCCPRIGGGTPMVVRINQATVGLAIYGYDHDAEAFETEPNFTVNGEIQPGAHLVELGFPPACGVAGGLALTAVAEETPEPSFSPLLVSLSLHALYDSAAAAVGSFPGGPKWDGGTPVIEILEWTLPEAIYIPLATMGCAWSTDTDAAWPDGEHPLKADVPRNGSGTPIPFVWHPSSGLMFDPDGDGTHQDVREFAVTATASADPCWTSVHLVFSGNISYRYGETGFRIVATWFVDVVVEAQNFVHNSDPNTSADCCSGGLNPCTTEEPQTFRILGNSIWQGTHVNSGPGAGGGGGSVLALPFGDEQPIDVQCVNGNPSAPCGGVGFGTFDIFYDVEFEVGDFFSSINDGSGNGHYDACAGSADGNRATLGRSLELTGYFDLTTGGVLFGFCRYETWIKSFPGGLGSGKSEILVEFNYDFDGVNYVITNKRFRYGITGRTPVVADDQLVVSVVPVGDCRFRLTLAGNLGFQEEFVCPISGDPVQVGLGAAPYMDVIVSAGAGGGGVMAGKRPCGCGKRAPATGAGGGARGGTLARVSDGPAWLGSEGACSGLKAAWRAGDRVSDAERLAAIRVCAGCEARTIARGPDGMRTGFCGEPFAPVADGPVELRVSGMAIVAIAAVGRHGPGRGCVRGWWPSKNAPTGTSTGGAF